MYVPNQFFMSRKRTQGRKDWPTKTAKSRASTLSHQAFRRGSAVQPLSCQYFAKFELTLKYYVFFYTGAQSAVVRSGKFLLLDTKFFLIMQFCSCVHITKVEVDFGGTFTIMANTQIYFYCCPGSRSGSFVLIKEKIKRQTPSKRSLICVAFLCFC